MLGSWWGASFAKGSKFWASDWGTELFYSVLYWDGQHRATFCFSWHRYKSFLSKSKSDCSALTTKRLLHIPFPLPLSLFILVVWHLSPDTVFRSIFRLSGDCGVCVSITFLQAATHGLTNILKNNTRLTPIVPYLPAMSASVVDLVDTVDLCPILDECSYDNVALLIAWHTMKCADRLSFSGK